jgi:Tol biopolymer transport system component
MTTQETFGRDLSRWLREDAEHRVPDHLTEVLVRSAATRQRPWWSSPERWLPMDTVAARRPLNLRPLALIAVVVGALLLAAVAALWVASQRPSTFHLASNGRIFVLDGQTLKSYAASGGDPQVTLDLPATAVAPSISPDGRSIAYILETLQRVDIVDIENGTTTTIPLSGVVGVGGPVSWSPDGSTVLFNTFDGQQEHLVTAKPNGTDVREIDTSALSAAGHIELWPAGWSPSGDQVAFVAATLDTGEGTVYVVRPDGTDMQSVGPKRVATYSVSWSPDPSVERLVLATSDNPSSVQILDVTSGDVTTVDRGYWPTWSPDGSQIAYWNNGTIVAETAGALAGTPVTVRPYPAFYGACEDHANLADKAYCGPAAWSPDGQRLLAPDIARGSILSVMADGSGDPIVIQVDPASPDEEATADWQPIPR